MLPTPRCLILLGQASPEGCFFSGHPLVSSAAADGHLGLLIQPGSALAINLLQSFALSCVNTVRSFPQLFPRWDSSHPCYSCLCKPTLGLSLHQRDRAKLLSSLPPTKKKKRNNLQNSRFAGKTYVALGPRGMDISLSGADGAVLAWYFPWGHVCRGAQGSDQFSNTFGRSPLLPGSFSDSLSTYLWPGPQILEQFSLGHHQRCSSPEALTRSIVRPDPSLSTSIVPSWLHIRFPECYPGASTSYCYTCSGK